MKIELHEVGKTYGKLAALRGVSTNIPAGARVALLGPNGSGKSTLTRVIAGLVSHTGVLRLDGLDAARERVRVAPRVAYVPQIAPQMAAGVGELVRLVCSVRDVKPQEITRLGAALGLDVPALAHRPFRGLSGGMKQKLLLSLALASPASLFILDEPTASLDPAARARFFELYQERAGAATLLLSSHRLEEIRHLVDHVLLLEEGQLVYDGPAERFLAAQAISVVECRLAGGDEAWLRGEGFRPGAAGWWSRTVEQGGKLALVTRTLAALEGRVADVVVRDLETLTPGGPHA
jgi:ABC-2 type transport system ATP-binding protein